MIRSFVITIASLLAGCVTAQTSPVAAPNLICIATQECIGEACKPSDLEFNLTKPSPTGVVVNFIDNAFDLTFVETTSASTSAGTVTLNTYETTDMRLTLANDGTTPVRARLTITRAEETSNISAQCTPLSGDRP